VEGQRPRFTKDPMRRPAIFLGGVRMRWSTNTTSGAADHPRGPRRRRSSKPPAIKVATVCRCHGNLISLIAAASSAGVGPSA